MKHGTVSDKEHSIKRKTLIIAIVLIACLAIGLILAAIFTRPGITDVKSLVNANIKAQSQVKSYHMDGKVDMDITLDYQEYQTIINIWDPKLMAQMDLSVDSGGETAHVFTNAGVSIFGETVTEKTAELYLDVGNMAVYSKTGDPPQWKKTGDYADQIGTLELAGGLAIAEKAVLENAEFSETDEFYTLTMPAEKAGDLINELHLLERVDLEIADLSDIAIEGGQIIYNVDKTTLLVSSVELKDVDCRGKGTYGGFSVNLLFTVNGTFSFSRYDELEESEYAIPAEVTETQTADQ